MLDAAGTSHAVMCAILHTKSRFLGIDRVDFYMHFGIILAPSWELKSASKWFRNPMTPVQHPTQKTFDVPLVFLEVLAKTTIFEVSQPSRVDWYQNFWIASLPDPFRSENLFFDCQLAPKAP